MTPRARLRFARVVFALAGVYGLIVLATLPWGPAWVVGEAPARAAAYFYGYLSVTIAWQFVFLLIASDPPRYRPLMLLAALAEKFAFVVVIVGLVAAHRVARDWLGPATIDGLLGIGFVTAFVLTPRRAGLHT